MTRELSRRDFLKLAGAGAALLPVTAAAARTGRPNVVLCMADDLGWADTGYNGHPTLKTPCLDAMAAAGLRFDRFYAAAPVCSPTRGSAITGRHPYRYGVLYANNGHMRPQETTLAEVLRAAGYATGHFGKWHLGTLTKTVKDSNRGGPEGAADYSPPWDNGFERCFSTEAKVPTYDPMHKPGTDEAYGTYYWREDGSRAAENLEGDDSRVIMDRAVPFIEEAVAAGRPFFAVIWFHAPHRPCVAGPKHLALYPDASEDERHYYGCITAMDEQLARLRGCLRRLGAAENTMLWFCSDNGPEGQAHNAPGSAGPLRGRKRDLYEGGIRAPGLLEWPAVIRAPRTTHVPCCTLDYLPTVLDAAGAAAPEGPRPWDGVSLMPLIAGAMKERPRPIAFESRNQVALVDNRYKLYSEDFGRRCALYDLEQDPGETEDIADAHPERAAAMKATLEAWRASCQASREGADYGAAKEAR